MQHIAITHLSGRPNNPALAYLVNALLQSEQDKPTEVVFRTTCANPEGELFWRIGNEKSIYGLKPPAGVRGTQVREALVQASGLNEFTAFPKESEFIFELEGTVPAEVDAAPAWRLRWIVSQESPEHQIVLRRVP